MFVDFVLEQTTSPVDVSAVAAALESAGVRDVDAEKHGDADVFALAERVYAACRARLIARGDVAPAPVAAAGWTQVLQRYGRGLVTGLPMLVQTGSVLLLAFVLYSLLGYDVEKASVVALATLISLVVTGGFVQCIGRLGTYYAEQQSFELAQQVSWRLVRYGLLGSAGVGVLAVGVNDLVGWFPPGLALDAAVYYALLTTMWLLLAVLYAMQLRVSIVGVFLLSTLVVALTDELLSTSLEVAHWSGLVAADVAAGGLAWWSLRRRASGDQGSGSLRRLPHAAIHAYGLLPYFTYGVLYFSFLFVDRLLAWTVGDHPLPLWFNATYEVGLDLALVVLVLMLPQLEYSLHAFSDSRKPERSFPALALPGHLRRPGRHRRTAGRLAEESGGQPYRHSQASRYYLRFYRRQLLLLGALGAVAAGVVTLAASALYRTGIVPNADGQAGWSVFLWGTVGYALLVVALLNGVFMFSLSTPWPVVGALLVGLLANITVGGVLSRYGEYWWSVGGLVVGAFLFACITTISTVRVLRHLDYYNYAAF